jgi:hypothetical protein
VGDQAAGNDHFPKPYVAYVIYVVKALDLLLFSHRPKPNHPMPLE